MDPLCASVPLAFGALIRAAIAGLTVAVRIVLEERALRRELEGYGESTSRVRCRQIPGVWQAPPRPLGRPRRAFAAGAPTANMGRSALAGGRSDRPPSGGPLVRQSLRGASLAVDRVAAATSQTIVASRLTRTDLRWDAACGGCISESAKFCGCFQPINGIEFRHTLKSACTGGCCQWRSGSASNTPGRT